MKSSDIKNLIILAASEMGKKVDESSELIGPHALFDSIDLVEFSLLVEEKVKKELGRSIYLLSDKAFSMTHSPFRNLNSLYLFILELL